MSNDEGQDLKTIVEKEKEESSSSSSEEERNDVENPPTSSEMEEHHNPVTKDQEPFHSANSSLHSSGEGEDLENPPKKKSSSADLTEVKSEEEKDELDVSNSNNNNNNNNNDDEGKESGGFERDEGDDSVKQDHANNAAADEPQTIDTSELDMSENTVSFEQQRRRSTWRSDVLSDLDLTEESMERRSSMGSGMSFGRFMIERRSSIVSGTSSRRSSHSTPVNNTEEGIEEDEGNDQVRVPRRSSLSTSLGENMRKPVPLKVWRETSFQRSNNIKVPTYEETRRRKFLMTVCVVFVVLLGCGGISYVVFILVQSSTVNGVGTPDMLGVN